MSIDHFGNCATNLSENHLAGLRDISIQIKDREIRNMIKTYGERTSGELVALLDSDGRVEIAIVNGSAAQALQARVGDLVQVFSNH